MMRCALVWRDSISTDHYRPLAGIAARACRNEDANIRASPSEKTASRVECPPRGRPETIVAIVPADTRSPAYIGPPCIGDDTVAIASAFTRCHFRFCSLVKLV